MTALPHITVCIATYRRERLLEKLLDSLFAQRTDSLFTYSIAVADNDPQGSAGEVVRKAGGRAPVPIAYCVQPIENISITRNAAVEMAQGEFIAFADDDEYAGPEWLFGFYTTSRKFGAEVCHGPVLPYFEPGTGRFFTESGMFERPRARTGDAVYSYRGCGNCFFARKQIEGLREPFDPALGLSGGEDTVFFRGLAERGCRFAWCDEACVHELVPAARARLGWWAGREFRNGRQHVEWQCQQRPSYRWSGVGYSALKLLAGAGALLAVSPSVPLTWRPTVKRLRKVFQYAGQVSAHFSGKAGS